MVKLLGWGSTAFGIMVWALPIQAQVVGDRTLPSPTQVAPSANNRFAITGGTQAGGNLFHSFRQFSIPNNGTAAFQNLGPTIDRVISRVTGSSQSRINGTLTLLQSDDSVSGADFFLINPNGIIFGPNAELNLGGSFLATTADTIQFEDGIHFHADNRQEPSLLTVSVPVGLQFGDSPGPIRYRSMAQSTTTSQIERQLQVPTGKTLALLGGDLQLTNGILTAIAGRIELGSMGAEASVQLENGPRGWVLTYNTPANLQTMRLRNTALNTSGPGSGTIHVRGETIHLQDSRFLARTFEDEKGGPLSMNASRLRLDNSFISASVVGPGQGSPININVNTLVMLGGSKIEARLLDGATGSGGTVAIAARALHLRGGAELQDDTSGVTSGFRSSAIQTLVFDEGQGGNIVIDSDRLTLQDGAQISADTRAQGDAGNITIEADTILIDGVARDSEGNPLLFDPETGAIASNTPSSVLRSISSSSSLRTSNRLNVTSPSTISALTLGEGQGGTIRIQTQHLQVINGATVQTSTLDRGNAGNLIVDAQQSIRLDGIVAGNPGGLFSFSGGIAGTRFDNIGNPDAVGNGGQLRVKAESLTIENSAVVGVGSLNPSGQVQTGGLTINANTVRLRNEGTLLSDTASGNGGNIGVRGDRLLVLEGESLISSTAGLSGAGGDGGNLTVNIPLVVSTLAQNSDIQANAFTGNGGQVDITTQGIFGIEFQVRPTLLSDITASSQFGIDGEVIINTPDVDPSEGTIELPTALIDVDGLLDDSLCERSRNSRFVAIGRGGLPASNAEPLMSHDLWQDQRLTGVIEDTPSLSSDQSRSSTSNLLLSNSSTSSSSTSSSRTMHESRVIAPVTEAQGWHTDPTGITHLTTVRSDLFFRESIQVAPACQAQHPPEDSINFNQV